MDQEAISVSGAVLGEIGAVLELAALCKLAPWSRLDYESELERHDAIFLVARNRTGNVCGFVVGRMLPGAFPGTQVSEIYSIGVEPSARRSGIGSMLIRKFARNAARRGASEIFLEVRSGNEDAIEFYKKWSFEAYSIRPAFYRNPPDSATLMRASINSMYGESAS